MTGIDSCTSRPVNEHLLTQFKYKTRKNYQLEKKNNGEDITFEGFLEKLELIEGITIIKMTRQGTGDEPLSLRQEPQWYNE